ncbi:MAG: bacteriohemerythrin [Nitrosomonadales bacterium]|nr:bacteriohemerythrin [Nitrosomonadales bacterium]
MDSQNIHSNSRSAMPVLLIIVVMLATLLAGSVLFDNLRNGIRRDVQGNITAVGKLKANQIEYWLGDRVSDARIFSENSFFSHEVMLWLSEGRRHDARRGRLIEHMGGFLGGNSFRSIVLYDAGGRVMLRAGDAIHEESAVAAGVRAAVASGQTGFIDLHLHGDASFPVGLGFISPLREGRGYFGAIYLVEDPEKYLFPMIHEWPSDNAAAETQLVRKEGDNVLFLDKLRHRDEPPLGFSLPLGTPQLAAAIALRGKQGVLENARDYRGRAVLAYATAIPGTPWMLISKIDADDAYRRIDRLRRVTAILTLIIFGLTGAWFRQWRRRGQAAMEAAVLKERGRADFLQVEGAKRFRMVFEHTALPMVRNALNGDFIEVNDAWCHMFGYSREETLTQHLSWQKVTHPEDMDPGSTLVKKLLSGEIAEFRIEKRYIRKDGKVLWGISQVTLVRDDKGVPEYFISAIQDITERKQSEQQISFMAYHDKLTGLPNRALLFDRLSQSMSQAKRDGKYVALLFVDLDGFKAVNDEHGHEAGDAVLKMSAQRFLACVRAADTVARFGGDEFAIILGNLDAPEQARGVAEKIVQAFGQSLGFADGGECTVGASVGISIYPDHGSAMDNLLMAADRAMYESKRRGKNTYTFFKDAGAADDTPWIRFENSYLVGVEEIDEQHRNLVYLVNRLNDALKHDESKEAAMLMFDELLVATTHHFDTESRYMSSYHYPNQSAHEVEHAHLINEALQMKSQFRDGRELLALQSIKDWLLGHIIYSDKKMAAYLRQQGMT